MAEIGSRRPEQSGNKTSVTGKPLLDWGEENIEKSTLQQLRKKYTVRYLRIIVERKLSK